MVKHVLKQWNKHSFISPTIEKTQIKKKLEELQKNIQTSKVTIQIQKEELNLQCTYQNFLVRE
jgi:hypothetical protein